MRRNRLYPRVQTVLIELSEIYVYFKRAAPVPGDCRFIQKCGIFGQSITMGAKIRIYSSRTLAVWTASTRPGSIWEETVSTTIEWYCRR